MSKRPWIRSVVLVAAGISVAWVVVSKLSATHAVRDSEKDGAGGRAARVTTYAAEVETIYDTLSVVGTLRPAESIAVRNETPGKVERLHFEGGEAVKRGQPLVRMRNGALRAELEMLRRRRDLLELEVKRFAETFEKGGVSRHQYDVSASELAIARAEIERIEARLDETVVRAPFDGVIGLRAISEGAILTGTTDIAELRQVDRLDLRFAIPERFASRVAPGQPVRFQAHGSGEVHFAEISAVESGLDARNRTLRVEAEVDNADGAFRAGATARVLVILGQREDVLTIPPAAIIESSEGSTVWIARDGKAVERSIQRGHRTDRRVEVVSGLSPGDEVVVTGQHELAEGQPLEIDESDDAPDIDEIGPDGTTSGMRSQWFSEEELEEVLGGEGDEGAAP